MQLQAWTTASIEAHQAGLKQRICEFIPLKDSVLKEAHARGLSFGTHAALKAALRATPELPVRAFNKAEFIQRIAELSDDVSAEVVTEILDDVRFNVSVVRRSEQRNSAGRYDDIAYDVEVAVTLGGDSVTALDNDIHFHLPEFGRAAGFEPYRVDSAHDRRAVTEYRKTRFGAGQATCVAKLVDGHWNGSFYVYAPEHKADDSQCIRSLKVALARAILPRLPTRARCWIFRPDNYQVGAWRVEMRLPPGVQRFWSGSPIPFDIPQLRKRLFLMESEFHFGLYIGRFVDGVWKADLYSNGIEEAKNPTSLTEVKRALLQCVNTLAQDVENGNEDKLTPVVDDAGHMVGTVKLRSGQYEAWSRARTAGKPGNLHKFLGRFRSLEESTSAIRTSLEAGPREGQQHPAT